MQPLILTAQWCIQPGADVAALLDPRVLALRPAALGTSAQRGSGAGSLVGVQVGFASFRFPRVSRGWGYGSFSHCIHTPRGHFGYHRLSRKRMCCAGEGHCGRGIHVLRALANGWLP